MERNDSPTMEIFRTEKGRHSQQSCHGRMFLLGCGSRYIPGKSCLWRTITMFSFFHSSYQNSPENKISSEVKPPAPSQPLVLQGVESAPGHGRGDGHCPPCRALLLSLASGFGTRVWRGAAYPGHLQAESHALSLPVPLCSCGIWGR